MIELDIVVDKRGALELMVLFDCVECDWAFEDHGIEVVDAVQRKAIETNRNDGGNGSHVQEGFGRRLNLEGLIYPGIDPKRIMPNLSIRGPRSCSAAEAAMERREVAVAERSGLWCST